MALTPSSPGIHAGVALPNPYPLAAFTRLPSIPELRGGTNEYLSPTRSPVNG